VPSLNVAILSDKLGLAGQPGRSFCRTETRRHNLGHGSRLDGHLTHGMALNMSGKWFNAVACGAPMFEFSEHAPKPPMSAFQCFHPKAGRPEPAPVVLSAQHRLWMANAAALILYGGLLVFPNKGFRNRREDATGAWEPLGSPGSVVLGQGELWWDVPLDQLAPDIFCQGLWVILEPHQD
jgi:hypothetical protein